MATAINPALKSGSRYADLKRRLWFLLGALIVYRIGTHIPVPGINSSVLQDLFRSQQDGRVKLAGVASAHQGLGVRHYIWASSPLRRYVDLVNQRQLIALALGELTSSVGAGARPGAEVHVFTPFGTLRYGDATLRLQVDRARFSVDVDAGDVWLDPAGKPAAPALKLKLLPEERKAIAQRVLSGPAAIRDGHNGLLYPPGNRGALIATLRRALGDAELRQRLAAAARRTVEERFRFSDRMRQELEVYDRVCSDPVFSATKSTKVRTRPS